ncbi:MAG TPA: indole-3-glycerol phosphate synthase TrpC, partial [Planctomycetota bacterium]|nr:indole-3-glycerol phosphate synthase TrpC [Planctomycetota bacterium]
RVIAEVKKASPSRGVIREDFDPVRIAEAYERGGAAAISVLTDGKRFQGSLEHLAAVRAHVRLPVLRKDFVVDSYQVREARAAGADAILLILAALPDDGEVRSLAAEAEALGMDVLHEVHEEGEMRRALGLNPRIVGINNRDLRTFEVRLETTRTLAPLVPEGVVVVSESGFSRREDLEAMRGWGVEAFLIGETLMRAPDPGEALRGLLGGCAP